MNNPIDEIRHEVCTRLNHELDVYFGEVEHEDLTPSWVDFVKYLVFSDEVTKVYVLADPAKL